jgi:hypothetical protein
MWPRIAEIVLAFWLLVSFFVLGYDAAHRTLIVLDVVLALLVLGCLARRLVLPGKRMPIGVLAAALTLVLHGFLSSEHPMPLPMQNHLIVGCLLALLALVPSYHEVAPDKRWVRL